MTTKLEQKRLVRGTLGAQEGWLGCYHLEDLGWIWKTL
jgi:hypothetical protein